MLCSQVTFPKYLSPTSCSLLKGLLERNVDKRLGCGKSTMYQVRGVAALKQHAFFKVPLRVVRSCSTFPGPVFLLTFYGLRVPQRAFFPHNFHSSMKHTVQSKSTVHPCVRWQGVDWRKVERKEYPGPISLALTSPTDRSYFDTAYTSQATAEAFSTRLSGGAAAPLVTPPLATWLCLQLPPLAVRRMGRLTCLLLALVGGTPCRRLSCALCRRRP